MIHKLQQILILPVYFEPEDCNVGKVWYLNAVCSDSLSFLHLISVTPSLLQFLSAPCPLLLASQGLSLHLQPQAHPVFPSPVVIFLTLLRVCVLNAFCLRALAQCLAHRSHTRYVCGINLITPPQNLQFLPTVATLSPSPSHSLGFLCTRPVSSHAFPLRICSSSTYSFIQLP